MRLLIRIVAVFSAVSFLGTVWFVAAFAAAGGLRALLTSGLLGGLTIVGWVIALVVGPVATVQLWRFRQSGRRAGIVLFGTSRSIRRLTSGQGSSLADRARAHRGVHHQGDRR